MAEKQITIYCIASALDGEGGTFKPGDKVTCDSRGEAAQLIATGRFTKDEEAAKRAGKKKVAKKEATK